MDLIQKLEKQKKEVENRSFKDNNLYTFLDDLINKMSKKPDLSTISKSDMLIALMTIDNKLYPFEEITDVIYDVAVAIDYVSIIESGKLLTAIFVLKENDLLDDVLKYDSKPNVEQLSSILNNRIKENLNIKEKYLVLRSLTYYIQTGMEMFADYYDLKRFAQLVSHFNELDIKYARATNYSINYDKVIEVKQNLKNGGDITTLPEPMSEQEYDIALEALEIESVLKEIKNYDSEISKKRSNFLKQQNKLILTYDKLIAWVQTLDNSQVAEIPYDTILKIDNTELQNELIKKGLENNRAAYLELTIDNIKKDKYNGIEKIFYKHKINFNVLEQSERKLIIESSNSDNLDQILEIISSGNWPWLDQNYKFFTAILLNTSKKIINHINQLIKEKIITQEFVSRNPEILVDSIKVTNLENNILECKYKLFSNNLYILRKYMSHFPHVLKNNTSLLLEDTFELSNQLQLIEKYQLNMESDNASTYNLEILNNSNLFDDLDTFIELGYKDIILNNPQLLRKNVKQILGRLSIAQAINLEVVNSSNRFQGIITNGKNFYLSDSSLEKYQLLPVEAYYEDPNFEILGNSKRNYIDDTIEGFGIVTYLDERFKISELEYQFQDVIISRMKVLRNICALLNNETSIDEASIVLSAIIYHTVLDNSTIDFIKTSLREYESKKYVKKN